MLHLGIFFKYPREMTLGRKSQIVSDCSKRFTRITEEALCFFRFFFKIKSVRLSQVSSLNRLER